MFSVGKTAMMGAWRVQLKKLLAEIIPVQDQPIHDSSG